MSIQSWIALGTCITSLATIIIAINTIITYRLSNKIYQHSEQYKKEFKSIINKLSATSLVKGGSEDSIDDLFNDFKRVLPKVIDYQP